MQVRALALLVALFAFDPTPASARQLQDERPASTNTGQRTAAVDALPAAAQNVNCTRNEGEPVCGPGYVDRFNGGCNADTPAFLSIADGDVICGTSGTWEDFDFGGRRDEDWYEFVVSEPGYLTWSVTPTFPADISIVNGNIDCADGAPGLNSREDRDFTGISMSEPVQPGVYWLGVAPSTAADVAFCGATYEATATFAPFDPPRPPSPVSRGRRLTVVGQWDGHPPGHSAADVWGDRRGYAYVGNREGSTIDIMDISDPMNPTLLANYQPAPPNDQSLALDVKQADGLLFIALDSGGVGAQIVDVRDPANPQHLADVNVAGFENVHNLFYDAGYLYMVNSHFPNMAVVDLTGFDPNDPPASPIATPKWVLDNVGTYFVHDVTVLSGKAYLSAWSSGVWIYDVTDIANQPPALLTAAPGSSTHSAWASPDGRWVVTNEERNDGGPIKLYEFNDGAGRPTLTHVFTYSIPISAATSSHNVYIDDAGRAYCAWYNRGLLVFRIDETSKSLVLTGRFDTTGETQPFRGAWGVYPFLGPDRVLVSDKDTQFWIFDVRPGPRPLHHFQPGRP